MLKIKAVFAFGFLFYLSACAAERDGLINSSSRGRKHYGKTHQEIEDLRKFLQQNLNNPSYRDSERTAIANRADVPLGKNDENERGSDS